MSNQACGRCGKDPAEGFATINDVRYCHEGPDPTCYMRALWFESAKEESRTLDWAVSQRMRTFYGQEMANDDAIHVARLVTENYDPARPGGMEGKELYAMSRAYLDLMVAAMRVCNACGWSYGGPATLYALATRIDGRMVDTGLAESGQKPGGRGEI